MRGEVYRYRPGREVKGHEQRDPRYGIVVLATRFEHLSRWLVVPTSTSAQPAAFRPEVMVVGRTTLALCDALVSVDPDVRLGERVGYLGLAELAHIDRVLTLLLDLR